MTPTGRNPKRPNPVAWPKLCRRWGWAGSGPQCWPERQSSGSGQKTGRAISANTCSTRVLSARPKPQSLPRLKSFIPRKKAAQSGGPFHTFQWRINRPVQDPKRRMQSPPQLFPAHLNHVQRFHRPSSQNQLESFLPPLLLDWSLP